MTPKNFKRLLGYTEKNSLIYKCFKGDPSDNISGVPNVGLKTLIKFFPRFVDEEYTINRIIPEAAAIYNSLKKPPKTLENIIGSRSTVERNYKLMNLKEPFLTPQAKEEVEIIRNCVLAKEDGFVDRSVGDALKDFVNEGYSRFVYENKIDQFFAPYFRMSAKEKEYTKKRMLES